jgi:hypothetical protein
MQGEIILWLSIAIFNVGVLVLLVLGFHNINVRDALREKSPRVRLLATSAPIPRDGVSDPSSPDLTSYSRVAGFIGATVMACFLWGIGNFVLFYAFQDPSKISPLISSIGNYFLAGASLFAPYAVNKLSGIAN